MWINAGVKQARLESVDFRLQLTAPRNGKGKQPQNFIFSLHAAFFAFALKLVPPSTPAPASLPIPRYTRESLVLHLGGECLRSTHNSHTTPVGFQHERKPPFVFVAASAPLAFPSLHFITNLSLTTPWHHSTATAATSRWATALTPTTSAKATAREATDTTTMLRADMTIVCRNTILRAVQS